MKYFRPTSVAAVVLATFALGAFAQEQKGVSEVERNYQAGTSPLTATPMVQSTNPKAPPMSLVEFEAARKSTLSAAQVATERCAKAPLVNL
jgi:nitrite reductase (NO-forming)/hydroxylamine reductase